MAFHNGMYDDSLFATIFGVGVKKDNLSLTLHNRYGLDINATLQHNKQLINGFNLTIKT
jgi:hypothetical protein